jgi:beta-lactam-binding protein with PASTA domain
LKTAAVEKRAAVSNRAQDGWPTPERIVDPEDAQTRALPPSPPPPYYPPPAAGPPPEPLPPDGPRFVDRLGHELLIGILVVALVVASVAIWLLARHRGNHHSAAQTTTVHTTPPATPVAPAKAVVPTLDGLSRAKALATLDASGLRASVHAVPGPPPAGLVVAQSPRAGARLAHGEAVRLNVSNGAQAPAKPGAHARPAPHPGPAPHAKPGTTAPPQTTTTTAPTTTTTTTAHQAPPQPTTVQVPTLSGQVKSAMQQLSGRGLLASIQYVPGDATLGTVVAQSPSAGASTQTGAHVTVNASSGPGQKPQETVPDVVGKSIPDAVRAVNAAGLRLILLRRTVPDRPHAGLVVEQTPQPGAHAPHNAQVLVYMGAYKG